MKIIGYAKESAKLVVASYNEADDLDYISSASFLSHVISEIESDLESHGAHPADVAANSKRIKEIAADAIAKQVRKMFRKFDVPVPRKFRSKPKAKVKKKSKIKPKRILRKKR